MSNHDHLGFTDDNTDKIISEVYEKLDNNNLITDNAKSDPIVLNAMIMSAAIDRLSDMYEGYIIESKTKYTQMVLLLSTCIMYFKDNGITSHVVDQVVSNDNKETH